MRNRKPRPGGYAHHGKRHALRLKNANARRAAVGLEPVSTLTQHENDKPRLRRLEAK